MPPHNAAPPHHYINRAAPPCGFGAKSSAAQLPRMRPDPTRPAAPLSAAVSDLARAARSAVAARWGRRRERRRGPVWRWVISSGCARSSPPSDSGVRSLNPVGRGESSRPEAWGERGLSGGRRVRLCGRTAPSGRAGLPSDVGADGAARASCLWIRLWRACP